ncbi:MAG: hypothetical protein PQJ59_16535 [Spirochaetales bacterium]|nr:hypothetical protein [Spirochaetales bacterium]
MFKEDSLIVQMAKGKYKEEIFPTKYGEFIFKYPSGRDYMLIEKKKADWLGGRRMDQFNGLFLQSLDVDATLSVVITAYPEGYPSEFRGDNIIDFPDQEVKNALYKAFITFSGEEQTRISGEHTE